MKWYENQHQFSKKEWTILQLKYGVINKGHIYVCPKCRLDITKNKFTNDDYGGLYCKHAYDITDSDGFRVYYANEDADCKDCLLCSPTDEEEAKSRRETEELENEADKVREKYPNFTEPEIYRRAQRRITQRKRRVER
jgi:hypothetical protein